MWDNIHFRFVAKNTSLKKPFEGIFPANQGNIKK